MKRIGIHIAALTITGTTMLSLSTVVAGPLHDAAAVGDLVQVEQLIAEGTDVDNRDDLQRTPLFRAATKGHVAIVEMRTGGGIRRVEQCHRQTAQGLR